MDSNKIINFKDKKLKLVKTEQLTVNSSKLIEDLSDSIPENLVEGFTNLYSALNVEKEPRGMVALVTDSEGQVTVVHAGNHDLLSLIGVLDCVKDDLIYSVKAEANDLVYEED